VRHQVPPDALLFIYQGLVNSERGCDRLLETFANASNDRHLVVMGHGPGVPQVEEYARVHANIHYQPAVPMDEVLHYTASADVGLFLLPLDSCLSYQYSLGNKFFEYLAAGLAVIVSDNPEMAAIVRRYDCGWVYHGDPRDFALFVNRLTKDGIDEKRSRTRCAMNDYTWECEEEALGRIYKTLFVIRTRPDGRRACVAA
jgi:glycosyltransferase involved in cell wall biosynthesis